MEKDLIAELAAFSRLSPPRALAILRNEGAHYEITKSLANLAFNLLRVESLEPSEAQKTVFERHPKALLILINPRQSLATKRRVLVANPQLATAIAATCHHL